MRYIRREEVDEKLIERGLSVRQWANLAGLRPDQVFSVLLGRAGASLSRTVIRKLHADGLISEMPEIDNQRSKRPDPEAAFWTMQQVSSYLNVSHDTVRSWVNKKKFDFPKTVKIGGVIRIDRRELEAWIQKRKEVR